MQNQIPNNWQEIKAEDICIKVTDGTHDTPNRLSNSLHPLITSKQLKEGIIEATDYFINDVDFNEVNRRSKVDQWDLLFGMIGTVGDTVIVRDDKPQFAIKNIGLFKTGGNENLSKWLYYYFKSPSGKAYIKSSQRGTSQGFLPLESLRKFPIIIPKDKSQVIKIVSVLSSFDDKIEMNNKIAKNLEETMRAIFKEWFMKFKFPQHEKAEFIDNKFGKIPLRWTIGKLNDVLHLNYGKGLKDQDREKGNVMVVGSSGVVGYHNHKLVKGPGIVVGRKGNVGSILWVDEDFYPIDTTFFVQSSFGLHYCYFLLRKQKFITSDSAVPGLNREMAYMNPIVIPDKKIVEKFEEIVGPMFGKLSEIKEENRKLATLRDLLLPKLMRGEVKI